MRGLWYPHVHPLTLYQGGQFGQIAASVSNGTDSPLMVPGTSLHLDCRPAATLIVINRSGSMARLRRLERSSMHRFSLDM
jgi:hypothetical protein